MGLGQFFKTSDELITLISSEHETDAIMYISLFQEQYQWNAICDHYSEIMQNVYDERNLTDL